jgi:acetyl esterase/lipase
VRQTVEYLQANAERLSIDPGRIVLAGDSARRAHRRNSGPS